MEQGGQQRTEGWEGWEVGGARVPALQLSLHSAAEELHLQLVLQHPALQ